MKRVPPAAAVSNRAKTTAKSTAGSFAPKIAEEVEVDLWGDLPAN